MRISLLTLFRLFPFLLFAVEADVIAADVKHKGGNYYQFTVTVQHTDESWDHFAKAWEVLDAEGNVLGVRILRHPHIYEQPFTRSQTIAIPGNVYQVTIGQIPKLPYNAEFSGISNTQIQGICFLA